MTDSCSVAKSCPIFCKPMDCSTPGSSVLHYLLLWDMFSENVCFGVFFPGVCSNSCPLTWWWTNSCPSLPLPPPFLLPSVFPSISIFSSESALCIKWPKMTEDEMVGWHHQLNGREFEQSLGDGEGQGSLVAVHGVTKSWTQLSNWTTTKSQVVRGAGSF